MPPKGSTKNTGEFSLKEKVLVPHTDKFYEAKIIKAEMREGMWYYFIHYQGWSKEWDEWVESPGLHKIGSVKKESTPTIPPNSREAAKRESTPLPEKSDSIREASPSFFVPEDSIEPVVGEKRKASVPLKVSHKKKKANDIAPQEVDLPTETGEEAVIIRLPASLKQFLLDEREAFDKGLRAPKLPRNQNVLEILFQYVENERAYKQAVDQEEQFASGLRTYFDKSVHHCLLYDHEVNECEKILEKGIMPSSQYGAEHLLRLLAQLPSLIPTSGISDKAYQALQDQAITFILYLQSKEAEYFLASDQYTN